MSRLPPLTDTLIGESPSMMSRIVADLRHRVAALEARSEPAAQAATSVPAAPEKPVTGRTFDDAIAWLRKREERLRRSGWLMDADAIESAADELERGVKP